MDQDITLIKLISDEIMCITYGLFYLSDMAVRVYVGLPL